MTIGISGWILKLRTKVREDLTIMESAPYRAFFWLKAPSAFKFKTLIKMKTLMLNRHQPTKVDVKLGY